MLPFRWKAVTVWSYRFRAENTECLRKGMPESLLFRGLGIYRLTVFDRVPLEGCKTSAARNR